MALSLLNTALTHDALLHELHRLEMKTRRLVTTTFAGEYRSAFRGAGLEVDQIRRYEYGDDVRSIDWNVSARTGSLHVRMYREEREQNLFVLLDVSASQAFGNHRLQKIHYALELVALFGFSALENNDRFALALCTDQLEAYFPPRKGRKHLLNALGRTLATQPARVNTGLRQGIEFVHRVQKRHANVVVISDFLDAGYERPLVSLTNRHEVLLLRLQHPQEGLEPGLGVLPVRDLETGDQHSVFTGWALGNWLRRGKKTTPQPPFEARFLAVHRHLKTLSRKYGIGYVSLNTAEDFIQPMRAYFHQRAKARCR